LTKRIKIVSTFIKSFAHHQTHSSQSFEDGMLKYFDEWTKSIDVTTSI